MAVRVYGLWTPFYWTMPLSRCACVHSKPVKSTLENVTRPLRDKGERKRGLQGHPCKLRAGETIHSSILLENSCVKCGEELHIHKRGCNGTPVKLKAMKGKCGFVGHFFIAESNHSFAHKLGPQVPTSPRGNQQRSINSPEILLALLLGILHYISCLLLIVELLLRCQIIETQDGGCLRFKRCRTRVSRQHSTAVARSCLVRGHGHRAITINAQNSRRHEFFNLLVRQRLVVSRPRNCECHIIKRHTIQPFARALRLAHGAQLYDCAAICGNGVQLNT
mmetsp:Transcript_52789/g.77306  ORF Transcript_52789/g.77306 Transcript_52789/m.77306 type:complete len:278 (-) Transcript_52789:1266-2099(-)